MEKKSIGKFIAALRKANGMTQKDLADRLNVSDKTVSRWEREEGTPDLSLIPVIAEIFEVTCDELLRGERKSPQERSGTQEECGGTPKGEKQRQRLWKSALSQYQTQTYISMGISVVGLMVALICNLAFLQAVLGFLCGGIFFVVSLVCQAIFLNRAFLSVEDAELDEKHLSVFRKKAIDLAEASIGVTVGFLGFTLPLLLVDAYYGLSSFHMLLFGIIGAAALLLVYAVVCYFLNARLVKKGTYILNQKDSTIYHHNHRLQRNCGIALVLVLILTFLVHQAATTIWGPWSIMNGTTFHDYESFITYMETRIPNPQLSSANQIVEYEDVPSLSEDGENDGETWYDEFGNEITEEEARHRTLQDKNGTVVCEYTGWNESVVSVRYTPKDGTVLPITVHTYDDLEEAKQKAAIRHVIFGAGYGIEVLVVVLLYFKKRAT